jgi:2-polyprenyl-3-methyl-5-hydroxy-6-metoxy-1,4-benzoquinol methylase
VGVDVSARSLEIAARRLRVDRMNERQRERLRLLHGSLTYRDDRLGGFDAAVRMEVIEHVESNRLPALERSVFATAGATPTWVRRRPVC